MLRDIGGRLCGGRNSPVAIVRINWSTVYCFGWDYHSGDTVRAYKPADVLRWGAQIVLISLSLRTGSEGKDAKNIEVFCDLCRQAHELGMPVVGEYFPVNDEALSEDELFDETKTCCRILYELGADIIKTFYTKNFQDVVAGCPIPILSLGGKRLASDLAALEYAQAQIESGSSGIVFGRNVIQSKRPLKMQKALLEVVKEKVPGREAAKKYGLL
jgi:DhnA family fructose-bisphosphate aldolase class Ia